LRYTEYVHAAEQAVTYV